ncbi:MAG: sensor histidine kinase [Pirellulaceae bacterium]
MSVFNHPSGSSCPGKWPTSLPNKTPCCTETGCSLAREQAMTKILVVDDSPDVAMLMARALSDQGYEVLVAGNGRTALHVASAQHPDVILLDIMMPLMDGIEVLHHLKQDIELRTIPVILVTAKSEAADIIVGLDAGAHDYVTKPFKKEILAARIRSAVHIKQNHDRLEQLNKQLKMEVAHRERMQQELARAQKLESIGHLAAGIAHEINTPAQYVGDNIRFLQEAFTDIDNLLGKFQELLKAARQGVLSNELLEEAELAVREADIGYLIEEAPKAIGQSLEGIERVANIVRAMKDFSHPGNGHKQAIDLNRAIRSTLMVSRNEWKYVAELITDFAPDLPLVPCLPGDFNQVILNLVINSAQAIATVVGDGAAGKGTITVTTRRDGDWAEIRIEDTGTGIPEDIRQHVFDPFFTTKDVGKGTGQGLTIVHSIVATKHGGRIWLETEVGRGTTFIVRLPIADQVAEEEAGQLETAEATC